MIYLKPDKQRWKLLTEKIKLNRKKNMDKKQIKDIVIYGAGGFGKEVACLINLINSVRPTWRLIGFIDDGVPIGTEISHFGCVIGNREYLQHITEPLSVALAIGNPNITKKIVSELLNPLVDFPNIICPNFWISDKDTFCIGKGNIIQGDCAVTCNVNIGDFNILNGSVVIGHDVKIGNYNQFMPATRISGEVTISNCNYFGVGSIILQGISIGNNTRIGAGAVLMTRPKEDSTYIGNPAKLFKY